MMTFEEAIEALKGSPIRLNLGCGQEHFDGWINCDLYDDALGADVKLDASNIQLQSNSVQEINASHLIEHFDYIKGQEVIEEWYRVLVPGGKLSIETPDLLGLCTKFVSGNEQLRVNLYGLFFGMPWTAVWNTHKFLYSETQLRWTLDKTGFDNIKRVKADSTYAKFGDKQDDPVYLKLEAIKNPIIKIRWPLSQKPVELEMLQQYFLDRNIVIKNILEIGVYYGGTTLLWGKMVKPVGGKVVAVDLQRPVENGKPAKLFFEGTNVAPFITYIEGDSHLPETKEKVKLALGDTPVDMLFIDGDHSYEGVKADWDYRDLVKPGGLVVFHDILDTQIHREAGCYVSKLWEELPNDNFSKYQILDPNDQSKMGIGIIHV